MMIYENIRLAVRSLMANKMRALLTMLGIIIGISSVIAIMTVGNSLTNSVNSSMSSMGANNIYIGLRQKSEEAEKTKEGLEFGTTKTAREGVVDADLYTKEMLEHYAATYRDSIEGISVEESVGDGRIENGKDYANVHVTGVSMAYFLAENVKIVDGNFFSKEAMDSGAKVTLISEKTVENLFDGDNNRALGSVLQVQIGDRYENFAVVGIYKYEESGGGVVTVTSEQDLSTNCYIPLKTAQSMNHTSGYFTFTVVTAQGVNPEDFAKESGAFFKTYYRNNRYVEPYAYSIASMVDEMTSMLSTITLAISIIAGIALLVGGIGVMNIMLVSVSERTREIGTRKALGAPNSSIRLQFIVESIVICIIGGAIGIILGIVLGFGFVRLLGESASPSLASIVISLTFSMAIGIFFGYYPANKAAKMDPIDALRYE